MNKKHLGSNLDDLLQEDQLLGIVEATVVKRVIAFQIAQGAIKSGTHGRHEGRLFINFDSPR